MDKLKIMIIISMLLAFVSGNLFSLNKNATSILIIEYLIFFTGIAAIVAFIIFRKQSTLFITKLRDWYGFGIVFLSGAILWNFILNYLGVSGLLYVTLFTLFSGLMAVIYGWTWQRYLNAWSIFCCAMWSAWIGSTWNLNMVFEIFAGMCVYDIIAVFRTKIMSNLILKILQAKTIPPMFLTDMDIPAVVNRLNGGALDKSKPIKGHLWGGGDIILGTMLPIAVSIHYGIIWGIILFFAEILGIMLNFRIVDNRRVGLPALPLLFSSEVAAYVLLSFFNYFGFGSLIGGVIILGVTYWSIDRMAVWQRKKIDALKAKQEEEKKANKT